MELETIVNLILNSSVSIVVICYFMFRDYKFFSHITESLQEMVDLLKINRKRDSDDDDKK